MPRVTPHTRGRQPMLKHRAQQQSPMTPRDAAAMMKEAAELYELAKTEYAAVLRRRISRQA